MKIGFLGTGEITSAMVAGLGSGDRSACDQAWCPPRNAEAAATLAGRFPQVSVAASNQQVVDDCETVVIAVRPQIAQDVLAELQFRSGQNVISLVSGLPVRRLLELVALTSEPRGPERCRCPTPRSGAARRRSSRRDAVAFELFHLAAALPSKWIPKDRVRPRCVLRPRPWQRISPSRMALLRGSRAMASRRRRHADTWLKSSRGWRRLHSKLPIKAFPELAAEHVRPRAAPTSNFSAT